MGRPNLYHWKKAAAELLFPRRLCACCGAESPEDILCPDCRKAQQNLRPCSSCASFVLFTQAEGYRCATCRSQERPFALARAALPYEGLLRERLLAFKYNADTGQRRYLAPLLVESYRKFFAGFPIDAVLSVPLSAGRLQERGYNHAEMLSSILAAEISLPHRPELLLRRKDTRPLAKLSPPEREQELQGAFLAKPDCAGRSILLVDDIFTSGATAAACSRALLETGANAVYILTVAAGWDLENETTPKK